MIGVGKVERLSSLNYEGVKAHTGKLNFFGNEQIKMVSCILTPEIAEEL